MSQKAGCRAIGNRPQDDASCIDQRSVVQGCEIERPHSLKAAMPLSGSRTGHSHDRSWVESGMSGFDIQIRIGAPLALHSSGDIAIWSQGATDAEWWNDA